MILRYRSYLIEKTFDLDKDVDLVYKEGLFDKLVKAIKSEDRKQIYDYFGDHALNKVYRRVFSSQFVSPDAVEAHKVNPITVLPGLFTSGSYYKPEEREIVVTVTRPAIEILRACAYDISCVRSFMDRTVIERFWNDVSEQAIKSTIYHELTHWIDDSLHGQHIAKRLKKLQEVPPSQKSALLGFGRFSSIRHSPIEINAQIHAIKNIKREIGDEQFNGLAWRDLFVLKGSLASNFRSFRNKEDYERVMRDFLKRLDREGLLGDGLKKYPSYKEMARVISGLGM